MTLKFDLGKRVSDLTLLSYSGRMRWESFFDDLEAQAEAQYAAQLRDEVAEGIRVERATEKMLDRLLAMQAMTIKVQLVGGVELSARLGPTAEQYFCLEGESSLWLICLEALRAIEVPTARPSASGKISPVKFSAVLRGIMRDRQRVVVYDISGQSLAEGTLVQVGADFLVIGIHPRDEYARTRSITGHLLLPLDGIGWVQTGERN